METRRTEIKPQKALCKSDLDSQQYTLSLLYQANQIGLIDDSSLSHIQIQIMSLLSDIIIKYTNGTSTSIREETAQKILLSVLYSLDVKLSSYTDPEDALESLQMNSVEEIYTEGLNTVNSYIEKSKTLYGNIVNNKLNVDIYAYNSTIDEALPDFFAQYDPLFKAQETWAGMDYPLLFDDLEGTGIIYIYNYLVRLAAENYLCSFFEPDKVNKILYSYGRVYRIDYRDALINVLEVLLTNSIFSILSGKSPLDLLITFDQYTFLLNKIREWDYSLCSAMINQAIDIWLNELHIDDSKLREYIKPYEAKLMPRLFKCLENDNLMNIIILDQKANDQFDIIWNEGLRLNNDDFRLLVDNILNCTDGSEKAALINANIHSIRDFIDVLEADCLFASEYSDLFVTLGDMELSVLIRIAFAEELRFAEADNWLDIIKGTQSELYWQTELASFLGMLDPGRIRAIHDFISSS